MSNLVVNNVDVASLNNGQLAGFRNIVLNGKMEIGQEATTITSPVSGRYLLDQWQYSHVSASAITSTRNSDVPTDEFNYSLRATVTTADISIAAEDFSVIQQPIEGYNVRHLINKTFTISFWVRSSKTGVHCVSLRNSINDRSFVSEYTINVADTWEKKNITIVNGLITTGTWNWTSGLGLTLVFPLAAGSTYQTTSDIWQTGNYFTTSSQVNCLDTIGNIFAITGVQLEVGERATEFEHRHYSSELALCQRYYLFFYGSVLSTGAASSVWGCTISWPVTMRVAPTLVDLGGGSVTNASTWTIDAATVTGCRAFLGQAAVGISTVILRPGSASARMT